MDNANMDYPSQESYISFGKAVKGHAGLYSTMRWDNACQKAISPQVSATVHKMVRGAA
jgi:hypothetical protein